MPQSSSPNITLQLPRVDLLLILDALESRAEAYENTFLYLDDSELDKPFDIIIEEVRNQDEASNIASDFRDVIRIINEQLDNAH